MYLVMILLIKLIFGLLLRKDIQLKYLMMVNICIILVMLKIYYFGYLYLLKSIED